MKLDTVTEHGLELAIALVLILSVCWYFLVYDVQAESVRRLQTEIVETNEEIAEVKRDLEKAANLRFEIEKYESDWQSFTSSLVSTENTEVVLNRLRSKADSHNVRILQSRFDFAPMIDKIGTGGTKPLADKARLLIEGRGRFFAIGDFLDTLESEPVIASVNFVELTYQQAVDPEIYFKARMDIFVLNDLKRDR